MESDHQYIVKGKDISVPGHKNFGKYLLDNIRHYGDKVALINTTTEREMTYKDIERKAIQLAASFLKFGVVKGDTVMLGVDKDIDYIPVALGIILTGATLSPNSLEIGRAALKHRMSIIKPTYLICTEQFWNKYADILEEVKFFKAIISLNNAFKTTIPVKVLFDFEVDVETFEPIEVEGQKDVSLIYYSSGTSGMPKGIQLTHVNCILHTIPDENKYLNTSFQHGQFCNNYPDFKTFRFLASGKKIIYSSEVISAETLLNFIEKYQVDILFTIPLRLYQLMHLSDIEKYNLQSLKIIHSRTAPLHARAIQKFRSKLPINVQILQAYGMTECGELCSEMCALKGPKLGSVGMPSPGIILKVVNLEGKSEEKLPPNKNGEIRVKGTAIMKGYVGIDKSTYLDKDGFFKTGDLGYYDEDGYFYIVDRIKEVMIVDGCVLAPIELETILLEHPGVKDAGVVSTPDPVGGDRPAAFVVRQPGANVTECELKDYVAAEVAPYMRLQGGVRFISELPRNARGKILRRQLREMLNEDLTTKNLQENSNDAAFVLKNESGEDVARAMITNGQQKQPFHIFDMNEIYYRVKHFTNMMPRVKIFYAMKANDHEMILKLLVSLGVGFDCASPGEIKKVLELGVHPRSIIYTMPSRYPDQIIFAQKSGVKHATFDTSHELKNIKQYWPDVSLLIRIRVESNSIYKLYEKFGCDPGDEAINLLEEAASLSLKVVGVAFHVGSVCYSLESFATGLRNAHKLFAYEASKGRRMTIVDIGGGFLTDEINTIDEASKIINSVIEELFPDPEVQFIAEPGRYICESAFTLYCNIVNVRKITKGNEEINLVFLNDGVHGTLGRSEPWHTVKKFKLSDNDDDDETFERALLFGPSCDYLDQIMRDSVVTLPKIKPSDWLVFTYQGSYTINFQSKFSCLEIPSIRTIISKDLWEIVRNHPIFSTKDFIIDPNISSVFPSTLPLLPEVSISIQGTPILKI